MKTRKIVYSSQSINAGVLGNIKSALNKLSSAFSKFVDRWVDMGIEVVSQKENSDGSVDLKLKRKDIDSNEDTYASIRLHPTDREGVLDLEMRENNGKVRRVDGLGEEDIESTLTNNFEEIFKTDDTKSVKSSRSIKVKLSKITASTGYDIKLHAITASDDIDILDAMDVVNDVVDDEEFISDLSEEPECFDLQLASNDDIEVSIVDSDTMTVEELNNTMVIALYEAIRLHANLKTIHWNASGVNFFDLHEKLDEYIDVIYDQIDVLGELVAELSGCAPNPGELPSTLTLLQITNTEGFTSEEGFRIAYDLIDEYIQVLQSIYCNFPSDIQSTLDEMIRYWKKESHYKLDRLIH